MSGLFRGIRGVLFDLDGTLLDSAPDLASAANALRERSGLDPLPLERYRPWAGAGARGMLRVAFGLEPSQEGFEARKQAFLCEYQAYMLQRTQVFAGVERLIGKLVQEGLPWGVVTNKAERFTLPLTKAMPLFDTAAAIISGDTTPHAKPHPEPLFEAARRMGLRAPECLYVGDDLRDIQAGKAAGMKTVAALYGYLGQGAEPSTWGADAAITSPDGLLQWLELP